MNLEVQKDLLSLGLTVTENTVSYSIGNKRYDKITAEEGIEHFNYYASKNADIFKDHWETLVDFYYKSKNVKSFIQTQFSEVFINAVKNSYFIAFRYNLYGKKAFEHILNSDIENYSKMFMIEFVDYFLCADWIYNKIRRDLYIVSLLEDLKMIKNASGSMGHVDLKLWERVFPWSDYPPENIEDSRFLHPLWTRKFQQYDLQHGKTSYDLEDKVYRLMNSPYYISKRDERQPNRSLSRDTNYKE